MPGVPLAVGGPSYSVKRCVVAYLVHLVEDVALLPEAEHPLLHLREADLGRYWFEDSHVCLCAPWTDKNQK